MLFDRFLEQWKNREMENKLLIAFVLILTIGMIAQSILVIYLANTSKTIIVPAYLDRKFYVEGDKASTEYIELMGKYAVELISNYTPESVEYRTQEFLRFINPEFYSQVSTQMLAIASEAKKYSISQYYVVDRFTMKGRDIAISGLLRRYAQDKAVEQKRTDYKLTFKISNGRFEVVTYEKIEESR